VPKSDEDYDLRVPKDMAYIFSGAYVPLSCKLIEQVGPSSLGTLHTALPFSSVSYGVDARERGGE